MDNNYNNEYLDDDFDMIDTDSINSNNNISTQNEGEINNIQPQFNNFDNIDNTNINNSSFSSNMYDSALSPMYDSSDTTSYEEELKTSRPFETYVDETPDIEAPKEVTYSNDFMDYDPILHNGLETDGNYTITQNDSDIKNDYVPEPTAFDSEGMMEYYSNENKEIEKPKEEVKNEEVQETYNTIGMMQDQSELENKQDSANMEMQTDISSSKYINNDIEEQKDSDEDNSLNKKDIGAISIYNKKSSNKEKTPTRKSLEMVGTVLIFALLILAVSFFPEISKFFTNLRN